MYQQKSTGIWKSDFKFLGKRIQQSLGTKNKKKAKEIENNIKLTLMAQHKASSKTYNISLARQLGYSFEEAFTQELDDKSSMSLSELNEYMQTKVWCDYADSINPKLRMDKICEYFGSDTKVNALDDKMIEGFRDNLRFKKGIKSKTINDYLSVLNSSINRALRDKRIVMRYPLLINNYRLNKKLDSNVRDVVYSKEDERAILNFLETRQYHSKTDYEYYRYILINFKLGLRPSEFFSLTISDIDLVDTKAIKVSRGTNQGSTKNNVVRKLPLSDVCVKALRELIELRKRLKAMEGKAEAQKSFKGLLNAPMSDVNVTLAPLTPLTDLNTHSSLKKWRDVKVSLDWRGEQYANHVQYAIRHTVATRCASIGFGVHQIMKYLGHKSIKTSTHYVHLDINDLQKAKEL